MRPEGDHVLQRAYNLKYRKISAGVGWVCGGVRTSPDCVRTVESATYSRSVGATVLYVAGYTPRSATACKAPCEYPSPVTVFRRSRWPTLWPPLAPPPQPGATRRTAHHASPPLACHRLHAMRVLNSSTTHHCGSAPPLPPHDRSAAPPTPSCSAEHETSSARTRTGWSCAEAMAGRS